MSMLTSFVEQKIKTAKYKKLKDGTYFGEISDLKGVWANASTLTVCKKELREVLEEWLAISLVQEKKVHGLKLPQLLHA